MLTRTFVARFWSSVVLPSLMFLLEFVMGHNLYRCRHIRSSNLGFQVPGDEARRDVTLV